MTTPIKTWQDILNFLQTASPEILAQAAIFGLIEDDLDDTWEIKQLAILTPEMGKMPRMDEMDADDPQLRFWRDNHLHAGQLIAIPYEHN